MSKAPRSTTANRDWGSDESRTSIMHVDMDAFFALCELARRPELRGLPVIVGGRGRGVVLAATYEARVFGVRSAMPMVSAMRLCPQAVIVPPDHRRYTDVSRSVMATMAEITPIVEQISIDEAFLDVSGARRRLGPPTVIGARLRAHVQAVHGVTCSVGIAKNKFLAKLASTHAKPDGMLLVPDEASVPFLRTLPVGALWGVGEKTEAVLARWGITSVAQLADTDVRTLQAAVGVVHGAHLHDLAWGRDPRPVVPTERERSIGNETTFGSDQHDLAAVEARLLELCDKVAARCREQGVVTRTVALKVRTNDFRTLTRSRTLDGPTDVARDLYRVARELLAAVDLRGLPVRLVGVRAENLQERAGTAQQLTLDEAASERPQAHREAELALDAVRERFGTRSIGLGAGGVASARQRAEEDADRLRDSRHAQAG
ncbi:DNA-directed DNA polymerase [Xylanimonas cellulosilytica DSM 15894]|uniref:DNA polymerase IV n=1 Tax=Xylanimonas cellulosilytica (strain DSM 15894 / JCM 12276 / CECT 5975 / KCTC 9989 / LMG 20990 / NBRC 107835 / XIL07) TaxID=446471 RepID=D1C0B2_XYLCX|nr:DNA polymerase IV [Xylanimonas cellulosilytica]ACZ30301.1 DNA-directed DNA polymerase [Xylanimonas cellulosilytica DSM 15894]